MRRKKTKHEEKEKKKKEGKKNEKSEGRKWTGRGREMKIGKNNEKQQNRKKGWEQERKGRKSERKRQEKRRKIKYGQSSSSGSSSFIYKAHLKTATRPTKVLLHKNQTINT